MKARTGVANNGCARAGTIMDRAPVSGETNRGGLQNNDESQSGEEGEV
jgi:hypothetical protein